MATRRTLRPAVAAMVALGLVATACGADLNLEPSATPGIDATNARVETVTIDGDQIELTSGLATFGSCDAVLNHLRTEGAERVGPWGFEGDQYFFGGDDVDDSGDFDVVEQAADEAALTEFSGGSDTVARAVAGEDFSGTNNQERGVDEPDFVKTDGERIFTITDGRFSITDTNSGDPVPRGSINVGYETREMLVHGNRVFLLGSGYGEEVYFDDVAAIEDVDRDFVSRPTFNGPSVQIVELDISNVDEPVIASELDIEGRYLSARLIDGQINVAIQSDQHDLGFVFPQGRNGEESAEEFNRQLVMETEISDWLPEFTLRSDGEESAGQLSECSQVHAPTEFAGFGSLSVVSIDAGEGLTTPNAASVLASGQNVYSSTNAMWISTNQWFDWAAMNDGERREASDRFTTQIHGFSIENAEPEYLTSGSVRGHLLNQFSLSEHEGVLRVASTDGSVWDANPDSESFVTTFAIEETGLRQLGQAGEMGRGEQIFAVRFVGDTAYVVTFRQTDPFYTVDLSDPENPVVLGELKITGFSGQLHPLSESIVLGIGQEATEEGRTTGTKVTLFDVSDLSNPIDVANWTLDDAWSDAQWDHRAFLWWPQEDLAVLPVQNYQEMFYGAIAFRIDLEAGTLEEAGRIEHLPDGTDTTGTTECTLIDAASLEQYREGTTALSELAWVAFEIEMYGEGQVQVCGEGQTGATGLFCERADWIDASEIGITDTIEICWSDGPGSDPIMRTVVTGDTLWSLSRTRLQANDLSSLEPGEFVTF